MGIVLTTDYPVIWGGIIRNHYPIRIQTLPDSSRIDGRKIPSPKQDCRENPGLLGHTWILRVIRIPIKQPRFNEKFLALFYFAVAQMKQKHPKKWS